MTRKKPLTLDDLRTLEPGEAQLVPFALWAAYQRRDGLVVTRQGWDRPRRCPIVYTATEQEEHPQNG